MDSKEYKAMYKTMNSRCYEDASKTGFKIGWMAHAEYVKEVIADKLLDKLVDDKEDESDE